MRVWLQIQGSRVRSRPSPILSWRLIMIIISTVILLPSAESFKKGCCQLQVKVCARSTGQLLVQACPGKSVVRWTDHPAMTIAVHLGRKATKQTNKTTCKQKLCPLDLLVGYIKFIRKRWCGISNWRAWRLDLNLQVIVMSSCSLGGL